MLTGYLPLGAGLVVTGQIRDNGQNVLQSSFQTGGDISPNYCHKFFLVTFLAEALIKNIIILKM